MRASGLKPSTPTCSALMYACLQNNNFAAARKVGRGITNIINRTGVQVCAVVCLSENHGASSCMCLLCGLSCLQNNFAAARKVGRGANKTRNRRKRADELLMVAGICL
jgi:hypothetical protein